MHCKCCSIILLISMGRRTSPCYRIAAKELLKVCVLSCTTELNATLRCYELKAVREEMLCFEAVGALQFLILFAIAFFVQAHLNIKW